MPVNPLVGDGPIRRPKILHEWHVSPKVVTPSTTAVAAATGVTIAVMAAVVWAVLGYVSLDRPALLAVAMGYGMVAFGAGSVSGIHLSVWPPAWVKGRANWAFVAAGMAVGVLWPVAGIWWSWRWLLTKEGN